MNDRACCAPSRDISAGENLSDPASPRDPASGPIDSATMVDVAAGEFHMGTDDTRFPADAEGPVRVVTTSSYSIGAHPVTNDEFAAFVSATGTVTTAESEGWSFVFGGLLPDDFPPTRGVAGAEWWRAVEGASWQHPAGPHSSLAGLGAHPVVHVTWYEAQAYVEWAGGRLPSEPEWERAARGGLDRARFPWGDDLTPGGVYRCNIWQGSFPNENTLDDGHLGTSPVATFPPNDWGLFDVAGNVWEWCADSFAGRDHHRVIRGGSYLCHESYCNRYRVGARSSNTADTCTGNMGFRMARDLLRSPRRATEREARLGG